MAKINVSIDTDAKTIAVDIDGEAIDKVKSFSGYIYTDTNGTPYSMDVSINTNESDPGSKVSKTTTYYAYASKKVEDAKKDGFEVTQASIKGLVKISESPKLESAIASLLHSRR